MNIAFVALTGQGMATALKLAAQLPEPVDIYSHEHCKPVPPVQSFSRLRHLMPELWQKYSGLVFVMATGIVVRQIAPYLERKDKDPAVLVIDENGKFVIPLVSGHLGGANAWSRYLAQCLTAIPVITTATDGRGLVAPDEYARRLGWGVYPLSNLPRINRLLLERGYLKVWTEHLIDQSHPLQRDENYLFLPEDNRDEAEVEITAFPKDDAKLYLIPPVLSIGVGCRQGTGSEFVLLAVQQALDMLNASPQALKGIFSIDLKASEAGLQQTAQALGIPFQTYTARLIQEINEEKGLAQSEFVRKNIGVDGVCEAASLLGAETGTLILPKQKMNGVTIAVSWERSLWSGSVPETLPT